MNPVSFQFALPLLMVLILAVAVPIGNYLINQKQGMRSSDNVRESKMWGVGFIIYAAFDCLLILF